MIEPTQRAEGHDRAPAYGIERPVAPPPPPVDPRVDREHRREARRSFLEWVLVIGGALAVALVIRAFLIAAFWIPSGSMELTLREGDRVLVNKLSYRLHEVNRGDVVVFERPPNESDRSVNDLIKRVVGLPGEQVSSVNGQVFVNGQPLIEPYVHLTPGCPGTKDLTTGGDLAPVTVPEGTVFVLGDNRCNSQDSRKFGPVDQGLIVGRAFVRIWPLGHIGWL